MSPAAHAPFSRIQCACLLVAAAFALCTHAGAAPADPCAANARKDAAPAASEPYQQDASAYRVADDARYRLASNTEYRLPGDANDAPKGAPPCDTSAAAPAPSGAPAYVPEFRPAASGGAYNAQINTAARAAGIQADLVHAVVSVESAYDAGAVSPKGAQGLMQLMPSTAALYTVRNPYDPAQNLKAGARYLRHLLAEFDNDLKLALAAYNSGPETVRKYQNSIPPYPETRDYVQRVLRHYHQRLKRSSTVGG